jgi:hypothetical protein
MRAIDVHSTRIKSSKRKIEPTADRLQGCDQTMFVNRLPSRIAFGQKRGAVLRTD